MSDTTPTQLRHNSDSFTLFVGQKSVMRRLCFGLMAVLTLTLSGCKDDEVRRQYTINATMEQLQNADKYGSKVQLINEEWTYWEYNDSIDIISNESKGNTTGTLYTGWLVNGGGGDYSDYNGVFITTLEEEDGHSSQWFVGVHPANYQKHKITYNGTTNHGFTAKVYLEPVQHYRHDSSYARQVLPMIATYDGPQWNESNPTPYRLDFHALAGLVRLQLLNGTGSSMNISKIELVSLDFASAPDGDGTGKRPLCGRFPVKNLYNFNAHLDHTNLEAPSTLGGTGDGYTLTLSTSENADEGSLEFGENELKSFYVVLPAFHGMDTTTVYHLQMKVYTTDNKVCSKNFTVQTRRNGITYMRAINITEFADDPGTGSGNPVLVGYGTSTRPFKIYTIADLQYVRDRFNAGGEVRINGQLVTRDTWFRIMRSDLVLTDANWRDGIIDFKGHMTYYSNAPHVTHGIVNQSYKPVFQSINADGVVKGLAVVTNSDLDFNSLGTGTDYSPLCGTNNGRIEDCRNISPEGLTGDARYFRGKVGGGSCYAGICITNNGTITGSDYAAIRTLTNNCNFAGICKENTGTVQGCALSSPAEVEGPGNRGGVVYTNNGIVSDCYCEISYSNFLNSANWGGIVYQNNTGSLHQVNNCYVSHNAILRSNGNVGGIVCINNGIVNYCHNESYALCGKEVGGIVATMNGGVVSNSYCNDPALFMTLYQVAATHSAGGIVAVQTAGTIRNCFAVLKHFTLSTGDATGTYGALVGRIMSNAATVENCYAYEVDEGTPHFYGSNNSGNLTHCHLLGATQTDVDGITTVNHASLETLLSSLNENKPGDGLSWTRGLGAGVESDTQVPTLVPPATTKRHH